ncbi:hypothetical protein B0H66DRAFT_34657 [Apodospora peruviana]|uniref:BTB domain-containing protein n=1 Tax=Apodospora peruviana TaxID=516989 RepID=A0AAE0MG26_9PEZI|nr:hypothetical protein B0H66DRAFT_34657 [Apodospora peruviana]
MKPRTREPPAHCGQQEPETVRVLVGKERREFTLKRKPLCACSAFFRDNLAAIPTATSPSSTFSGRTEDEDGDDTEEVLWLPAESPQVFELFVLWLYRRRKFHSFIDQAVHSVAPDAAYCRLPNLQNESCRRALRWNLVRLHLFAELIDLPALQNVAMDAIQDMYLRCDWDISLGFMVFLYRDCDTQRAVRLRKWAVAMLAWTLHSGDKGVSHASQFERLLATYPAMYDDSRAHLDKMAASNADVRIKNPQLRLPLNRLRNEERFFGFRQCSFHSHRAVVGEGSCPHAFFQCSPRDRSPRAQTKEDLDAEVSSDAEHHPIISPVSDLRETSFLDLS